MGKRIISRDYYNGLVEGIIAFAWWKDGIQYVGTCGTTLRTAINNIDKYYEIKEENSDGKVKDD